MPTELKSNKFTKGNGPKVQTSTASNLHKMTRVIGDLDQKYTEINAAEEAKNRSMEYINLYGFPIDTSHLTLMSEAEVSKYKIGIFSMKNKNLFLVTNDPSLKEQKDLIKKLETKGYSCKVFFGSRLSMEKLLKTYNHIIAQKEISDEINIDSTKIKSYKDDYLSFQKNATKYSMSEMIERVLKLAIDSDASDIHFEPEKEYYHLRLRLDGVLHDLAKLPKESQKVIESRIKIMSKLKLNVENSTQDGRFSFIIGKAAIDVRVSMLPSNYGYSIVMRLLGTESVALDLEALGFSAQNKDIINRAINKPQGLILTTGPTGSGKTTTLYAFLKTLNDGENKIITLEDPVEYKIEGLSQTQIDSTAGYTFAAGLRSVLRQDPDIVMVGEIRDLETAETAVQASFTGHQVLSTIHTNDAAGAIPRLMQMGLQGYLIADSLSIAIGQRLVRRLCNYCKTKQLLQSSDQNMIIEEIKKLTPETRLTLPKKLEFFTSQGCKECNMTGYKGRTGCYEVLEMTDSIRVLLTDPNISLVAVRNTARSNGMITMFQDGLIKCLQGVTDLKELTSNVSQ
jgi:type II secretory ATPase GspE/PulE/Tfp pilus assembly ATPase PilB-like protein